MDGTGTERPWRIRKAEAADREALEAVVADAFSVYLPRMDRKPFPLLDDYGAYISAGQAFVLEEAAAGGEAAEGQIRACIVLVSSADGSLALEVLAVAGEAQGRGYGRALADFAVRRARALGLRRLRLSTNEVMTEAQAFYTRLGFTETRRGLDAGYWRVFYELEVAAAVRER